MDRSGTPSAAALRAIRAARVGVALDGDRAVRRMRPASIRCRRSRSRRRYPTAVRRCRGASAARVTARMSCLVSWPSCSNQSSGRPGVSGMMRGAGAPRSVPARPGSAGRCRRGRMRPRSCVVRRSRGPPIASQTVMLRVAEPVADQKLRQLARRRLVPGQGEDAGARLQVRDDPFQRPAVQGDQRAVLHRPAETAGRQAEGRTAPAGRSFRSGGTSRASSEPMP